MLIVARFPIFQSPLSPCVIVCEGPAFRGAPTPWKLMLISEPTGASLWAEGCPNSASRTLYCQMILVSFWRFAFMSFSPVSLCPCPLLTRNEPTSVWCPCQPWAVGRHILLVWRRGGRPTPLNINLSLNPPQHWRWREINGGPSIRRVGVVKAITGDPAKDLLLARVGFHGIVLRQVFGIQVLTLEKKTQKFKDWTHCFIYSQAIYAEAKDDQNLSKFFYHIIVG